MPEPFNSRIDELIKVAGSLRGLSRFLGVSPTAVVGWRAGSIPYERTILMIADKTGVSMEWLRYGTGDSEQETEKFRRRFSQFASGPRSRLKLARDRADMSVAALAKKVGMPIARLQAIEEGDAGITEEQAQRLVAVLPEIELEELMAGSETPRVMEETGRYGTYGAEPAVRMPGHSVRLVPLLSWAMAGTLDNGALDGGYDYTGVIAIDIKDPKAFGVQIKGNSMEPKIEEGASAIVCPSWTLRSGDTVICRTIEGDVMCKVYQPKNGGELVILSSYNPGYVPVVLKREEIAWIYPVGQVVQNLRRE
jgi:repressor LexA